MAKYKSIVVTNAGLELIAAAQSGDTIEFTAMKTGAGVYTGSEVLSELTGLKGLKQTFGVTGITRDETVIKVRSVIDNSGLDTGYNITEIGLFAKNKSGNEIMYGVVVAETGFEDFLPAHSDAPTTITSEMHIDVSSVDSNVVFQATVIPGTYVTVEDFEDYKEQQNQYDNSFISSIEIKGKTITVKNKDGEVLYTGETQDTTYSLATTAKAGLMDSADKVKLNGIEEGAQKNTITGVKGSAESKYRTGDVNITKGNIGLGNVDNTSDADKPVSTAQQEALDLKVNITDYDLKIAALERADILNSQETGNVSIYAQQVADDLNNHKDSKANPHNVTKRHVGLGNVDNTSDANKPVSTAQQKALDLKADKTELAVKVDHEEIVADNLTPFPYAEMVKTQSDVVWNIDDKGIVKGTGTASADSGIYIARNFVLPAGTYTLSGCPKDGGANLHRLQLATSDYSLNFNDFGDGVTFTITEETTFAYFRILAKGGVTVTNLIFKPMLEKGTVAHPHQPHRYGLERVCKRVENILDNLLPYPYYDTTKIINGVTCTDNGDGSITFNGTATSDVTFLCSSRLDATEPFELPAGTYILTGCPDGGADLTYKTTVGKTVDGAYKAVATSYGNSVTFTLTEKTILQISPVIKKGTTVDNLVFNPVIRNVINNNVLREDLDTLMEDTGWITLKENGTHTDANYGTEYVVESPICYRIIRNQFWIKGNVNVLLTPTDLSAYIRLELPKDIVIPDVTVKLIKCGIYSMADNNNLFTFADMNISDGRILFGYHRSIANGSMGIDAKFNESILLD